MADDDHADHILSDERESSSQELAGRLIDRCQDIEAAMRRHIVRSRQDKTLEDLHERTFGQLLDMFEPHCPDQNLNDWAGTPASRS